MSTHWAHQTDHAARWEVDVANTLSLGTQNFCETPLDRLSDTQNVFAAGVGQHGERTICCEHAVGGMHQSFACKARRGVS